MKHGLVVLAGAVLLAWSLTGCIADDNDNDNDNDDTGDLVASTLLDDGRASGIETELLTVLRDQEAYDDLWEEHTDGVISPPSQPEVNFGTRMVVAIFLGQRPTDRHRIEIIEVRERDESFLVKIRATLPDDDCPVIEEPSQPWRLESIPQSDKMVAFSTEVELGCP